MRSTDKKVKMAIRKHILESFDDYDESPEDAFVREIDHLNAQYPQEAMRRLLNAPQFLFTYYDMVEYLNSIGLDKYTWAEIEEMPERKSNAALEKAADLYYNLIVREGTQMYYEIKEGRYKGPGNARRGTVSENRRRGVFRRR